MRRRAILVLLALAAAVSFAVGVRSWGWHHQHGWAPFWDGDQRRVDALAEACVRAAERVRAAPVEASPPGAGPH